MRSSRLMLWLERLVVLVPVTGERYISHNLVGDTQFRHHKRDDMITDMRNKPATPARLMWAIETLRVAPTDRLLEIGCGQGVAVSLVCEQLDGGHITAIDRSAKMIAMAMKRNAVHIAAGKASFHAVPLEAADFSTTKFDKIFAIRVGAFMRQTPTRELEVVKRHLAAQGSFHLVYDPPVAAQAKALLTSAIVMLEHHGFIIQSAVTKELANATVVCVIAGQR